MWWLIFFAENENNWVVISDADVSHNLFNQMQREQGCNLWFRCGNLLAASFYASTFATKFTTSFHFFNILIFMSINQCPEDVFKIILPLSCLSKVLDTSILNFCTSGRLARWPPRWPWISIQGNVTGKSSLQIIIQFPRSVKELTTN
jgi:hypothetical protein